MIPNLQLRNLLNLQNNPFKQPNLITKDLLQDNLTDEQKTTIEGFILTLSICIGALLITFSYLNFQNRIVLKKENEKALMPVSSTLYSIEEGNFYKDRIESINKIKTITQKTIKYTGFYQNIFIILEVLKNQTLVSFDYQKLNSKNFEFTLIVNSPRENLFNEIKQVTDAKSDIKNLTLLNKIKIENSSDYQYTIKGSYENR